MVNIILSFDDGRHDNYEAYENIMKPLDIPATFNITSGYILDNICEEDKPGPHKPMSMEEVRQLNSSCLCEIAGHGFKHDNSIVSLIDGVTWLKQEFGYKLVGIASPHSEYDLNKLEREMNIFRENNVAYLRISNDYSKLRFLKKAIRKINKKVHSGWLYYYVNKDSIMQSPNFLLYSVPVLKNNKLHEIEKFINILSRKNDNSTVIFMFHSILKNDENYYDDLFTWDYNDFNSLCLFLNIMRNNNKINIIRTIDLFT